MEANYEVVKDTLFGRLLGCSLSQVLQAQLSRNEGGEIDMTNLAVEIQVNGHALDLHKLFTVFEKSLVDSPIGASPASQSMLDPETSATMLSRLRAVIDALRNQQSCVGESFSDAISAASSSYYCGEYASESASEAGYEHSPGDCFLDDCIDSLEGILDDLVPSEHTTSTQEVA